jgi:hypothetical protein
MTATLVQWYNLGAGVRLDRSPKSGGRHPSGPGAIRPSPRPSVYPICAPDVLLSIPRSPAPRP